jgi:hypothetical protein
MSLLTNKHLVIAMLVAPILAVLAYYALDALVGERPQLAEEGQSYPLVEKPDCRWASGHCGLVNADFELQLVPESVGNDRISLTMTSAFPLDGAMIALVSGEEEDVPPMAMRPGGDDGLGWSAEIPRPEPGRQRLRLVVSSAGSLYYGDAATAFTTSTDTTNDGY